jgi:hypothetical protein
MTITWERAFSNVPELAWKSPTALSGVLHLNSLDKLKTFLDLIHIRFCLLKPFSEFPDYPLVESRVLLPSFEGDFFEYKHLPGFLLVAFDRPINYIQEVFQFDRLHNIMDLSDNIGGQSCPLENSVVVHNLQALRSRLARKYQDDFLAEFAGKDICYLENYPAMLKYLLEMDRAQIMSTDLNGEFYLSGVYGSLPSNLDAEIKRYGLRIKKFRPDDNSMYERNRLFVYQYLMELYGFGIVSERRTAAALFSRRLFRMGERFLVRVLGQSDRTITTLYSHPEAKNYPRLEKIALVQVDKELKDVIKALDEGGFFLDRERRVVILRVIYRQHKYNPHNVQQERALSVLSQEVIHPLTGAVLEVNLIKDTYSMILRLTDIVRGEYFGTISYKRNELVRNTDTHEKRLKFLYSWLSKHQRRIIAYSDEFYGGVVKILDSYLLNPEDYETFNQHHELHQEVWAKYSYIQQARKVKVIEDLLNRFYKGQEISYLAQLRIATEILSELKFEIVNYFDELVETVLAIGEQILANRYVHETYVEKTDDKLTSYGQDIKKYYRRVVALLDEFRAIRRSRKDHPQSYALDPARLTATVEAD